MFSTSGKEGVAVAITKKTKEVVRFIPDTQSEELPDDDFVKAIYGVRQRQPQIEANRYKLAESKSLISYSVEQGDSLTLIPPSLTSDRERDVYFLSGRSGSGKSYLSAELLTMYRKAGRKIFVITDIPDEKFKNAIYLDIHTLVGVSSSYETQKQKYEEAKIKFKHRKKMLEDPEDIIQLEINLNNMKPDPSTKKKMELKFTQEQIDKMFKNSEILFDDYENNADKHMISYLRDHLLTKGRHSNTSLIICNHLTNFGNDSRLIMAETTDFVLFKKSTPHSRAYFMKQYLELSKVQTKLVQSSLKQSRWVCLDREMDIQLSQTKIWRYE